MYNQGMKEYNRTTKKWGEATDIKLKKRELCKGGKEHDYLLVLPDYVSYTESYKFNPEAYYELMEDLDKYTKENDRKLVEMGLKSRLFRFLPSSSTRRNYMCSVCKKKKYA